MEGNLRFLRYEFGGLYLEGLIFRILWYCNVVFFCIRNLDHLYELFSVSSCLSLILLYLSSSLDHQMSDNLFFATVCGYVSAN